MRMARDGGKIVKFTQQRPTSRVLAGGFSDISIRVGFVGRYTGGGDVLILHRLGGRRPFGELMPLKFPLKAASLCDKSVVSISVNQHIIKAPCINGLGSLSDSRAPFDPSS